MIYVLLLMVGMSGPTITAEFNNPVACVKAAESFKEQVKASVVYTCSPKGQ